jgi:hypothetical protein
MSRSMPAGRRSRALLISCLALLSLLLNTGVALADQVNVDNDLFSAGNQNAVNLSVTTGETISTSGQVVVGQQGSKHLSPSQTLVFTVSPAPKTTLPAPFTVGDASVLIPSTWTAGSLAHGSSSISFTAPAASGSYSYTVQWQPGVEGTDYQCASAGCLTGQASLTVNLTVTEPPPSDLTAPATAISLTPTSANGDNGWYRSAVTAMVSATDPDDSVTHTYCVLDPASVPTVFADLPAFCAYTGAGASVSADGTHTIYAASVDSHGNQESPVVSHSFKIDASAPGIVYAGASPAADSNGWNDSDVTLTWSCSDTGSGVVSATVSQVISGDGGGQSATGACHDQAGNTSTSTDGQVNLDKTQPAITFIGQTPAANAGGWNTSPVTLSWSCGDLVSGVESSTVTEVLSGEGSDQSATGTCTDLAGNTSSSVDGHVNLDLSGPTTTLALTPASPDGDDGWYATPVAVTASAADSNDPIGTVNCVVDPLFTPVTFAALPAGCAYYPAGAAVSGDGTHTVYAASADANGNQEQSIASATFRIDSTPPTLTFVSLLPAPNANGWNNGPVTVTWSCTDDTSGVATPTVTDTLSFDGADQSATAHCSDRAGNTASASRDGINIDQLAPVIVFDNQSPAANGAGWNNSDVTLTWACSDTLSGASSATVQQTVTAEGVGQGATGTCTDLAGNSAGNFRGGLKIDRTAPGIGFLDQSPAANANGWNDTDVTLSWGCSDALSGPADTTVTAVVATEGAGQQATGTCLDVAGNSASLTSGDVNLDKSAPFINFAGQSPAANGNGWNDSSVTLTWTCTDAGSGPLAGSVTQVISSGGTHLQATGTCADLAGNSAASTDGNVNLDETAPTLAPTVSPNPVLLNGPATASANASDSLSGISGSSCGAVGTSTPGVNHVSCTATDKAGNSATAQATYAVDLGFGGFLSPLNPNPYTWNSGNSGRVYPIKWQLTDADGHYVTNAVPGTSIHLDVVSCPGVLYPDPIDYSISAAGSTSLRYDSTANQYVFNWSTPATKNACYQLVVTTPDNVAHVALFQLR